MYHSHISQSLTISTKCINIVALLNFVLFWKFQNRQMRPWALGKCTEWSPIWRLESVSAESVHEGLYPVGYHIQVHRALFTIFSLMMWASVEPDGPGLTMAAGRWRPRRGRRGGRKGNRWGNSGQEGQKQEGEGWQKKEDQECGKICRCHGNGGRHAGEPGKPSSSEQQPGCGTKTDREPRRSC